jgi:hypothetical protein
MKLKRLLSLAVLCVAGWTGNAYAYEVGQDITASVQKEWKDKTGTYQQKYTERYSGTAYSSGKILYMSIDNLESKGYYEVQFYAVTSMAWNNFATGMNIAEWYVNDVSDYMNVIAQTDCTPESETNLRKATVYVEDGKLEFGIRNIATGGNWYITHLKSIVYKGKANSNNPIDVTSTYIKNAGFESGDLTGWTTEQSNDTGVKDAKDATYKTQGSEGNKLFNTWSDGKALTQNIGKLNAGIYELSAMLATGDNPDSKGTVYLTVNDAKSAGMVSRNGNKQVMHKETLTFVSDGKTETTIGAVGMEIPNGHWWYKADDFKLTFVDNTNNLFKVLTDVIANTAPWTTSGEYVNKYNEYKGLTETSAQADILSAINYLKTNYYNYAWENASVEHPYLMSNVIAKAELDDNKPWPGSGRLTKDITDHWSGGKKTVFVQNSGEYARKQAITVPYSGKYLLKTAVRTFTDKAFANIKMGDVVSSTNTKTGNTGGNVNIDGTEGTNNLANGNAGYGWTFNNLYYWCDADNTNTEIAIQLSVVDNNYPSSG